MDASFGDTLLLKNHTTVTVGNIDYTVEPCLYLDLDDKVIPRDNIVKILSPEELIEFNSSSNKEVKSIEQSIKERADEVQYKFKEQNPDFFKKKSDAGIAGLFNKLSEPDFNFNSLSLNLILPLLKVKENEDKYNKLIFDIMVALSDFSVGKQSVNNVPSLVVAFVKLLKLMELEFTKEGADNRNKIH